MLMDAQFGFSLAWIWDILAGLWLKQLTKMLGSDSQGKQHSLRVPRNSDYITMLFNVFRQEISSQIKKLHFAATTFTIVQHCNCNNYQNVISIIISDSLCSPL